MSKPLSSNQKLFIRGSVRVDGVDERVALWRTCHCAGWEGATDASIKGRITSLLKRADADLVWRAEQRRHDIAVRQELLMADQAVGQSIISAEKMYQDTINRLYDQLLQEEGRLEEVDEKSGTRKRSMAALVQGSQTLLRELDKRRGQATDVTDERADALLRKHGIDPDSDDVLAVEHPAQKDGVDPDAGEVGIA